MWLKYSSAPIVHDQEKVWSQSPAPRRHTKPEGCWFTDETEDCWRTWCIGESYNIESLTHKHEIILDESRLLILRSAWELDAFEESFHIFHRWGDDDRKYVDRCINWQQVAERYAGLIITPYIWARRLHDRSSWYYGWDCASGCVWDAKAIRAINLIEISAAPVARQYVSEESQSADHAA